MESINVMHADTEHERLPWHRPELRRIVVTLDTRNLPGSGADELTFGPLVDQ